MTNSNATRSEKIWALSEYLRDEGYYEMLLDKREECLGETTLKGVGYDRPAVQTSPGDPANQYCEKIDRMGKLDAAIKSQRVAADIALENLQEIVRGISGARKQRIFRLRYICGYDWHKVSVHVGLSESRIYTIHREVLDLQIDVDNTGHLIVK